MNQTITNSTILLKRNSFTSDDDDYWVEQVLEKIKENGGKEAIHVLEIANKTRLNKLKQKGWYAPHLFNKTIRDNKYAIVSTDIKEKQLHSGKWTLL
jgi:hypothetical protein